jgi:O-antigen ligase
MRTGFVSLAVEVMAMLFLFPKRIVLRLLPVGIVGMALFVYRLTPDDYWDYMGTIRTPTEEASANSRFIINAASLEMLKDYPMGVGYRNYPDVSPRYLSGEMLTGGRRSAHNSYFSIVCETGIIGFIVWISAFVGALALCLRIRKGIDFANVRPIDTYALAIIVGLLGWIAGGCFQADHEVDPAYWFVGFSIILMRLHRTAECNPEDDNLTTQDAALQRA